jgi:hypothetical protein
MVFKFHKSFLNLKKAQDEVRMLIHKKKRVKTTSTGKMTYLYVWQED